MRASEGEWGERLRGRLEEEAKEKAEREEDGSRCFSSLSGAKKKHSRVQHQRLKQVETKHIRLLYTAL